MSKLICLSLKTAYKTDSRRVVLGQSNHKLSDLSTLTLLLLL